MLNKKKQMQLVSGTDSADIHGQVTEANYNLDELSLTRKNQDEPNQKYWGASELVTALTQRATQEEAARRAAEQALAQTSSLLEETQRFLQEERTAVQQQLARWSQQEQSSGAAAAAALETEKNRLRLEAELTAVQSQLDAANQKYRAATEQVATLKQRVTQEEAAHQAAEKARAQAAAQLEQIQRSFQEERSVLQQQLAQSKAEGQAKASAAQESEKNLIRLDAELAAMRSRLEEANQKYKGATEQVATLKQQVTQEEATQQGTEKARAQAAAQLEQIQRSFQEERSVLQQQLAQLSAEGQAKTVAVYEGEKNLIRLEAELAARSRLEEANHKYQSATEEVSRLKQQVTQEEAARRAAEQALHEAQRSLQEERSRLETANQKYKAVTEQAAVVKQQATEEETARQAAEQALQETSGRLDQANSKYRQVTGSQIPELKNKLKQLERAQQQKIAAERQLVKTRAAISFQLGYLLIHSFKSLNGFLRLPSGLWALRKETIERRKKKAFVLSPPKLLPSEPSVILSLPSASTDPLSQEPPSKGRAISADATLPLTIQPLVGSGPNCKLNIACIMDEFTFGSFQPEAVLHQLTPSNWKGELEASNPDLLFIESAWRGKDELWGSKVGHTSAELQGIVAWCRAKNVPTVFWCKEDPIHFETFLNTAKLVDHVFTTDIDCIHRYKAALGHDRVYLLPFACQPAANNPIETYQRKDAFCFAGAYYVRYPERTRDLGDFVMELPTFRPLEIYDRNYGKNDPNYQFPEEYQQYIVGTLPFDQIDKAYKGYRYAINLNSIKQSQSMFARRVFELLASNTITISNFSRGIRHSLAIWSSPVTAALKLSAA